MSMYLGLCLALLSMHQGRVEKSPVLLYASGRANWEDETDETRRDDLIRPIDLPTYLFTYLPTYRLDIHIEPSFRLSGVNNSPVPPAPP
ncbi:hypothetical protein HDK64DRAFT_135761 [Phyllosticta capitalensis]